MIKEHLDTKQKSVKVGLAKLTLFFVFVLVSSGCSLNQSSDPNVKQSVLSEDVDFGWDLWPELEENKPIQEQTIKNWSPLKDNTTLFLGDESLQSNWGLVLQHSFLKLGQNSWFLSTCMTARDFKNGQASQCGYWTNPFEQTLAGKQFITIDQTQTGERLAPKLISDAKVNTVVISFGHRVSVMEDRTSIQQELSAIELMAKWAHSAGKKCFVIEPTDALFVETRRNDFLNDDQKKRLKVAVTEYCEWIDAQKLKNDYLNLNHIDADKIIAEYYADDSRGFIPVTRPELYIDTRLPELDLPEIKTPKNVNDPAIQSLPQPESIGDKVSRRVQEKIKESLDQVVPPPTQDVVTPQTMEEPRYLWNGHNNGSQLTEIGRKYLNSDLASHLLNTRDLRDAENFCPKYWSLNKKQKEFFWIYLYSAIARFENDRFNPSALHKEKQSGRHSIGIFQVDTQNCGYGADSNKEKLYDLDNNFKCALSRGTSLAKRGRQIADGRYVKKRYTDFGLDGYWSVLRKPYTGAAMNASTGKYQNVTLGRRGQIINLTRSIKICK